MDYRSRKAGSNVSAQLSILGPEHADREQVEKAIAKKLHTGQDPKGWSIKWTEWRGREVGSNEQKDFFNIFARMADEADTDHEAPRTLSASELRDRRSEDDPDNESEE